MPIQEQKSEVFAKIGAMKVLIDDDKKQVENLTLTIEGVDKARVEDLIEI